MGASLPNESVSKREIDASRFIPYGNQVTTNTVALKEGGYCQTIRLQGAAHESADNKDINNWHAQLNMWLRNLASPNIAVWTHVVRREYSEYPAGEFENDFARRLNAKYRERMVARSLLINELYVTVIYRPEPVKVLSLMSKLIPKSMEARRHEQEKHLEMIDEAANSCMASLDRYDPELLGVYEHNGQKFTEIGEFFGFLINGEWRRVPLARSQLCDILTVNRPFFGNAGVMGYQRVTEPLYSAVIGIAEYPNLTRPECLDDLLGVPFEFVLAQSFTFLSKQVGVGRMRRQKARLDNAGDVAESQVEEIAEALDGLVSNEFAYGVHHLALTIKSDDKEDLKDCVSLAGTILGDASIVWAQEDEGLMGAFYSMLPGNFSYRTRLAEITSRNFACFANYHNYPIGHIRKNQWGNAVTMFLTSSGAPYFFNFHKGEEGNEAKRAAALDPNHKDLANFVCFGNSGGGKTVLEMFLLSQTMKFSDLGATTLSAIVYDKDLGASVAVRALGGRYFALKNGVPTGWQPLQMTPSKDNLVLVESLLKECIHRDNMPLSPRQESDLSKALAAVMNEDMPIENRRIASLLEFFDAHDEDGLYSRLHRWSMYGENGWVFDNPEDTLSFEGTNIIGIDVTAFLKNAEIRSPCISYLFHRQNQILDGRRVPIFMDEFGQLVKTKPFEDMTEDKLVTIRKLDGFLGMFTQFPKQITSTKVGAAIISQTATKIFLPNKDADYDDYVVDLKLSVKEFLLIKQGMDPKAHEFLIKQGGNSVVARLDLKGFDDELAVLSGNAYTAGLTERLIEKVGNDPKIWLPLFHKIRKGELDESQV